MGAMRQVIVFCRRALPRAAWLALLRDQPGIAGVTAAAAIQDLAGITGLDQAAIFVAESSIDVDLVRRLAADAPGSGLLLLVDTYQIDQMVALLQAGAAGLISRDASVPELVRAIIAVGRGEIVLPPDLASRVMLALARGGMETERPVDALTDRESEVLALLAQGLTNKDIAQTLFLSVRTVEAHLRNIYAKVGVSSRTEAALWAIRQGYSS